MNDFTHLVDLASQRLGGRVIAANDEFFAPKENLLKASKPVFIEDKYTDRGKWMDGWETRRRRTPGFDWCMVRLGLPGILRGLVIDTSFFRGNFPSHASVEACVARPEATAEALSTNDTQWFEVLPKSELKGDTQNRFVIADSRRFTHLRLNIYPDGGVARLRVHGEVLPDWKQVLAAGKPIDLAAIQHGGRMESCSDMFFSHPLNLLMPGRGARMDDGWETRRRRGPGHDWVVLRLGIAGTIQRVEVDTAHFKGNYPESCSLEACAAAGEIRPADLDHLPWKPLLPRMKLQADAQHSFEKDVSAVGEVTHVRFNIYPDGGISRLRLLGAPSRTGRQVAGIRLLNAMLDSEAKTALLNCCGSGAWAQHLLAARPFRDATHLTDKTLDAFALLKREDWMAAFWQHPRIGENKSGEQSAEANQWSQQEQSTALAGGESLSALADANQEYEKRFGHIFVVCASGKSSDEILGILRNRLNNARETEFMVACDEQKKITRLRLEKLIEL